MTIVLRQIRRLSFIFYPAASFPPTIVKRAISASKYYRCKELANTRALSKISCTTRVTIFSEKNKELSREDYTHVLFLSTAKIQAEVKIIIEYLYHKDHFKVKVKKEHLFHH